MSSGARRLPQPGLRVEVIDLAWRGHGTVIAVSPDRHALSVELDDGEVLAFALNAATARFTVAGSQSGARLAFLED